MKNSIIILILLPLLSFSMNYTVYKGDIDDHSNPNIKFSLQYFINKAHNEGGGTITLGSNSSYNIKNRILLKNGIVLVGKRDKTGFELQNIIADNNFPPDLEMILVYSGKLNSYTTVKTLRFKGNNRAWRIARTTEGGNFYRFDRCRMEETKNKFQKSAKEAFNESVSPSSLGDGKGKSKVLRSSFYDVSLIYCKGSNYVEINKCDLYNAGLNQYSGKINGTKWGGFGSGIRFQYCDNITVQNSRIERTLTEGIRLSGCKNVIIDNNTIIRTAMNSEWFDASNRENRPPIASGITGYHNQGANKSHYGGMSFCVENEEHSNTSSSWIISNNRFYWNYNNAISVSGSGIEITGNRANYTYQNALYLGDWRSCTNGEGGAIKKGSEIYGNECTRNILVSNNNFENSYYDDDDWTWVFNIHNDKTKTTYGEQTDIRIDGYDNSVNVHSNITLSGKPIYNGIWWNTDRRECSCLCNNSSPKSITSEIKKLNNNETTSNFKFTIDSNHNELSIENLKGKLKQIIIFDLTGKIIPVSITNNKINISHFTKNIYFIKVVTDKEIINKKIMLHSY